jgi:integrase
MASALVHRGTPAADIASIADLATRENIDSICDFFAERSGRPNSVQVQGFLAVLRPVALHQLKDRTLADWISRRMRRLFGGRHRRFGMTEKNRRRLAVFRDRQHVRDLLLLPYKLLKRAETGSLAPMQAARLVRMAVAIELEIMCPIRLQNLSEINVDTDFVRSHAGKKGAVHLFIPGHRTKNGEEIELELPRQSVALIDLYLAKHRAHLIEPEHRGRGPRFLFPTSDGSAQVGRNLGTAISSLMLRELGIAFNVHLFRHLGCFLYLRSHPGQIDVMRRVLGHKDANTTMRFYASVQQSDAFQLFDTHVLQIREEAMRPRRSGSPRHGGAPR